MEGTDTPSAFCLDLQAYYEQHLSSSARLGPANFHDSTGSSSSDPPRDVECDVDAQGEHASSFGEDVGDELPRNFNRDVKCDVIVFMIYDVRFNPPPPIMTAYFDVVVGKRDAWLNPFPFKLVGVDNPGVWEAFNDSICSILERVPTAWQRWHDNGLEDGFLEFDMIDIDIFEYAAQAHGVRVRSDIHKDAASELMLWLLQNIRLLSSGYKLRLLYNYRLGGALQCELCAKVLAGGLLHAHTHTKASHSLPLHTLTLLCGDWPLSDICSKFSHAIAQELSSFRWPIDTKLEVERLLGLAHAAPTDIVGGEFTAAIREENARRHGCVTLSVDLRASITPGVHATLDLRLVLPLKHWRRVYAFPPCTHQTLSDTTSHQSKQADGRTFWGIAFVIWCWCADGESVMIEQPDTVIPKFYIQPTQRLRTSELGDDDDKTINLYMRGVRPLQRTHAPGGKSQHKRLRDFNDAEERDRWRSSWLRFPRMVTAVVEAARGSIDKATTDGTAYMPDRKPDYLEEIEQFAAAWYDSGLPVPIDYDNADAQPTEPEHRAYQSTRGQGDGRRYEGVVPKLRRPHALNAQDHAAHPNVAQAVLKLCDLSASGFVLCFVAMQAAPLVYAMLDGVSILGAELDSQLQRPPLLRVATRMAEAAIGARTCAFIAGEYLHGARVVAVPLDYNPGPDETVRSKWDRRRLCEAGILAGWCSLQALGSSIVADPAKRAVAACTALRSAVPHLADSIALGHDALSNFRFGVYESAPIDNAVRHLATLATPLQRLLQLDMLYSAQLRTALFETTGDSAQDMLHWADRLKPPELSDVPGGLLGKLPGFEDAGLDALPFAKLPPPHRLQPLTRQPQQNTAYGMYCPRSAYDLMLPDTAARLRRLLRWTLDDLACVREHGEDCARSRPPVHTISQGELHEWARGIVWDFRLSPSECGIPLDYHAPLDHTLNVAFFTKELKDYPNQRILSMIQDGVRYMADVELQGVFIPHLTSMPKGFASLNKELHRFGNAPLHWVDTYNHPPFFPIYFNARGATPRKLEDRWRGTTEGGGPRKPTWDADGLRVLSLNEAARTYHMPRHFQLDTRQEMADWLRGRQLPPTDRMIAELAEEPWRRGTKWERQVMPSPRMLMRDLVVLRRAARVLGEPLYLFGDDIKDYFMHVVNAQEELWKNNLLWIEGDELVFVNEKRMGFGLHPNAGIAQELSEAINHIFRRRVDAVEDPLLEADQRPAAQGWLRARRALENRVGGHQRRLYSVHMYCDDNVVAVVGVARALRVLKTWRTVTSEAGLIMAIPEKRSLGTWCTWLGILFFATLGIVAIPRSKLLRAAASARATLEGRLDFAEYRSLTGLLEHFRQAICLTPRTMHGLYHPMQQDDSGELMGPTDLVAVTDLMQTQLEAWLHRLSQSAGAAVTAALRSTDFMRSGRALPPLNFVGSSDAATEPPAGMGGFLHGFYWHFPIPSDMIDYLHITVLEMLATCFSSLIFRRVVPVGAVLHLQTDATAAYTALVRERERSDVMIYAHHRALEIPELLEALQHTNLSHIFGDANMASDLASRSEWTRLRELAGQLRLRLTRLEVPLILQSLLEDTFDFARTRGVRLRRAVIPTPLPDPPTPLTGLITRTRQLSPIERFLAGSQSCNENRDAVLHIALEGGIGVGKSTCIQRIANYFRHNTAVVVLLEPVADWVDSGVLQSFYQGSLSKLNFQLMAITTLTAPIIKALNTPGVRVVISERSLTSNLEVFAKANLNDDELVVVKLVHDALWAALPAHEQVSIFLDCDVHVIEERILQRARAEEAQIPRSYHRLLRSRHHTMLVKFAHDQHVIDASASATRVFVETLRCIAQHLAPEDHRALSRLLVSPPWADRSLSLVEQFLSGGQSCNENRDAVGAGGVDPVLLAVARHARQSIDPLLLAVVQYARNSLAGAPTYATLQGAIRLLRTTGNHHVRIQLLEVIARLFHEPRPSSTTIGAISLVVAHLHSEHLPTSPSTTLTFVDNTHKLWFRRILGTNTVKAAQSLLLLNKAWRRQVRRVRRAPQLPLADATQAQLADLLTGADTRPHTAAHRHTPPNTSRAQLTNLLMAADMRPHTASFEQRRESSLEVDARPYTTALEQHLDGGQSCNENRDAVSTLASVLGGKRDREPSTIGVEAPTEAPSALARRLTLAPAARSTLTRMPTVTAGSVTYAAPSGLRKERPDSARLRALRHHARRRAEEMASPQATTQEVDNLESAINAEQELADFGAAYLTLDKDDRAWIFWERFCALYNWDPFISAEFASRHADQVIQRMALFQAWVHPQLRGRAKGILDAKPSTTFNSYALAVHRILCRAHVPMPRAKLLEGATAGLKRTYKHVHSAKELMPNKKNPMLPSMWQTIENLPEGTKLNGRRAVWSPATRHRDRCILRIGRVLWRTGHRIGEICSHPSGEIVFITLDSVSARIGGVTHSRPTKEQLLSMTVGDVIFLNPSTSKCDQFGERWCPFPSVLPFKGTGACAGAAVRDILLEALDVPGLDWSVTPLFVDDDGMGFSYSVLHHELRQLCTSLFGAVIAETLSWHAIRIGLACALSSAGCPDEHIQLICRWASPESLRAYRQLGVDRNISYTDAAFRAIFDATRVNNIPALGEACYAVLAQGAPLVASCGSSSSSTEPSMVDGQQSLAVPHSQRQVTAFDIGKGSVQAYTTDDNHGLIGRTVVVPNDFWEGWSRYCSDGRGRPGSSKAVLTSDCAVVGECVRDFQHPDGQRCRTYLISYDDCAYPIKLDSLRRLTVRQH